MQRLLGHSQWAPERRKSKIAAPEWRPSAAETRLPNGGQGGMGGLSVRGCGCGRTSASRSPEFAAVALSIVSSPTLPILSLPPSGSVLSMPLIASTCSRWTLRISPRLDVPLVTLLLLVISLLLRVRPMSYTPPPPPSLLVRLRPPSEPRPCPPPLPTSAALVPSRLAVVLIRPLILHTSSSTDSSSSS